MDSNCKISKVSVLFFFQEKSIFQDFVPERQLKGRVIIPTSVLVSILCGGNMKFMIVFLLYLRIASIFLFSLLHYERIHVFPARWVSRRESFAVWRSVLWCHRPKGHSEQGWDALAVSLLLRIGVRFLSHSLMNQHEWVLKSKIPEY